MKKVPVVKITTPDAAADLAGLPLTATVAMADVAAAMREGLLAFSTAAGLVVMQQMLTEELAGIVGEKHAKLPDRVGNFGTTDGFVGHGVVAQGRLGAMPARSSMIMVMKAWGSWKPRALARMRPMAALFDSAIPLVSFHSMVASIDAR